MEAQEALRSACFRCGGKVGFPRLAIRGRVYHAGRSNLACLGDALAFVLVSGCQVWRDRRGNFVAEDPARHDEGCAGDRLTMGCNRCITLARLGCQPTTQTEL